MCGIKFGGLLLVFISLAVMIFSLLRKEEPFFNLRDIIKAHKQLIRNFILYTTDVLCCGVIITVYSRSSVLYGNQCDFRNFSLNAAGFTQHFRQL